MATFSVTEVESFKRCRRQWWYGSFNGLALTPILQKKPYLDLGTLIHKTLAYWTEKPDLGMNENGTPVTLRQVFLVIAAEHRRKAIERYYAATGLEPTDEEMDPLLNAIALGAQMSENYQEYYGVPMPKHLKFCMPEQEVIIPIPGTEHPCTTCEGTGSAHDYTDNPCADCQGLGVLYHYLKMRLDALAMDKRSNLYVVERKTFENHPNMHLLEVSDQFIGYIWGTQQLAAQMPPIPETGRQPRVIGLAYDGLWKRAGVSNRSKYKSISDLFVRNIITPAQDEVIEYGEQLADVVMDMANSPKIYKNRVWQGCWDCSFETLCRAQSRGDDTQHLIQMSFMQRTEEDTNQIVETVEAVAVH